MKIYSKKLGYTKFVFGKYDFLDIVSLNFIDFIKSEIVYKFSLIPSIISPLLLPLQLGI